MVTYQPGDNKIADFVKNATAQERMLVIMRDKLFGGNWALLRRDLRSRLGNGPFEPEKGQLLKDDIGRVDKLRAFERKHQVNLAEYFKGRLV